MLEDIRGLLGEGRFAVLATRGEEYPYCTLVGYAESGDCSEIVFATARDTRKYRNLKEYPGVSLLVDSRTNQVRDLRDARALTVLGRAVEIEDRSSGVHLGIYLARHPYLEDFVNSPNCALISVKVDRYILVSNFQNVLEYDMRD